MAGVPSPLAEAIRDRYTFERELGHGGMATVYLARDLKHDRYVAVKVLRPDLAAVLGAERFLREIRLTAQLQHPHILSLLDSGEAAGFLFYVMPYIEGESLRERLASEGQLSIEEALRITRAVAGALEYAHQRGVIHRDIKPENILLYQGEPMVADFGVALAAASAGGERLTETGLSLGTPAYMSPEQATAAPKLDGRSDQYSLACVLFEMLAGEPPYTGSTAQAIIAKRFSEPIPHLSTLRGVPPAIESAVSRALGKSPADRFSTVSDFAVALERGPKKPLISRRAAAVLGGIGALASLALLAFLLRPRHATAPMVTRQLTFSGKVGELALSPDGKSVAYVFGSRSLVVQRLAGGEPLVLVPPARFLFSPRWTRDGRTIVFHMFRDSTELAATYTIPAGGGAARKALEDFVPMDTGPDSAVLVRAPRQKHRLDFIDLRTGKTFRTVELPDTLAEPTQVEWAPDGRFIAFHALNALWTIPATGGAPKLIVGRSRFTWRVGGVRWSPQSDAVYVLDGQSGSEALFRIRIDPESGAKRGKTERVAALPGAGGFDLKRGNLVYTLERLSSQARVFRYGGQPRRIVEDRMLTEGTAWVSGVSISADGQWIAYSQDRGGDEDMYVVPFSGGSARAIASSPAGERLPRWSPDGSRLAFTRQDSTGRVVMVADVRSGVAQRASSIPGPYEVALWAADGKHLSFFARDLRRAVLVDLDRQSDREIPIPDSIGTGYDAVVPSPDGRELLASTLRGQAKADWGELWLFASKDEHWKRLNGPFGESSPIAFRPDGWIYLQNARGLLSDYGTLRSEIWRIRKTGAGAEFFAPVPEGCSWWVDLAADGQRGACVNPRTERDLFMASGFDPELR